MRTLSLVCLGVVDELGFSLLRRPVLVRLRTGLSARVGFAVVVLVLTFPVVELLSDGSTPLPLRFLSGALLLLTCFVVGSFSTGVPTVPLAGVTVSVFCVVVCCAFTAVVTASIPKANDIVFISFIIMVLGV